MMVIRISIIALTLVCIGCVNETKVSVLFDGDVEVARGSQVRYQSEVIGKIDGVTKEDPRTRVHLALDSEKLEGLKNGSAALLVKHSGKTNVELYNYRSGKEPLSDGDELIALHNTMEYVAWQTGETVDFAQDSLSHMSVSLQNFLQSEEWIQQKEKMQEDFERLGSDVQIAITEMKDEYETIIKQLEIQSKQSKDQMEKRYKELATTLNQQIEELLKNGEETLANVLQQFLDSLEQLMQRYSELPKPQKASESAA